VFEPRNLALEAVIREDRGDPAGYRVLGDWLEQRGHPRGQLIAVQAALAGTGGTGGTGGTDARRSELEREQARLLAAIGHVEHHAVQIHWRFGFWDRVSASADVDLAHLLTSPSARFVRSIHLRSTRMWGDFSEVWIAPRPHVLDHDGLAGLAYLLRRDRDRSAWSDALPSLRELGLGALDLRILDHAMEGPDGEAIASLRGLTRLELIARYLAPASVSRDAIRALAPLATSLEHLAFVECSNVDDAACEMIATMSRLERLVLDQTQAVTRRGLSALARLPRLQQLAVRRNDEIWDDAVEVLSTFPMLTSLDLTGMQITPTALVRLARAMPALEELVVGGEGDRWLDDRGCEILAEGRPPIASLRVSGSRVTLAGLAKLAVLPLRTLIVSDVQLIDDDAVDTLARFVGIERLDLRETPMSGEAIVRLANALPRLRALIVEQNRLPPNTTLSAKVPSGVPY